MKCHRVFQGWILLLLLILLLKIKSQTGSREMDQKLRALFALAENLGSTLSLDMVVPNLLYFQLQPLWNQACTRYIDICTGKIPRHIKKMSDLVSIGRLLPVTFS